MPTDPDKGKFSGTFSSGLALFIGQIATLVAILGVWTGAVRWATKLEMRLDGINKGLHVPSISAIIKGE